MHIVQYRTQPLLAYSSAITALGGEVFDFIENHAHIVRMDGATRAAVARLPFVRAIVEYQPEFRVDPQTIAELSSGAFSGPRRFNVQVFRRGPAEQELVAAEIERLGGTVNALVPQGFRMEATLSAELLAHIAALDEVRRGKAAGIRVTAETCPTYLTFTEDRYDDPDPASCARFLIAPPLRTPADRDALWAGLADGSLDLVATDHVPDRLDTEKAEAAGGISFDRISNGAPGIETLLTIMYGQGVAKDRITIERMVDLIATTPARRFGLASKGAIEVGRDADLVLFDPTERRTIRAADLHHSSDYTPYEGLEVEGAVRSVFVRGQAVVRDGKFVGQRGFGRFVERGAIA